jgi:hypothetical protein
MSITTERLLVRFERWLDRLVAPDTRYVCGGCDDRFQSRLQGVEHVLRSHPEYQGVVVYENTDDLPTTIPNRRPTWTNRPASGALWGEDFRPATALPSLAYAVPGEA